MPDAPRGGRHPDQIDATRQRTIDRGVAPRSMSGREPNYRAVAPPSVSAAATAASGGGVEALITLTDFTTHDVTADPTDVYAAFTFDTTYEYGANAADLVALAGGEYTFAVPGIYTIRAGVQAISMTPGDTLFVDLLTNLGTIEPWVGHRGYGIAAADGVAEPNVVTGPFIVTAAGMLGAAIRLRWNMPNGGSVDKAVLTLTKWAEGTSGTPT